MPAPMPLRPTAIRAARCCSGPLLGVAVIAAVTAPSGMASAAAALGVTAAAALLSTLTVLVIDSLSAWPLGPGSHMLLTGGGLGVVVGLLTLHPGWAVVAALGGAALAAVGWGLTVGRPSWRRAAAVGAGLLLVAALVDLGNLV